VLNASSLCDAAQRPVFSSDWIRTIELSWIRTSVHVVSPKIGVPSNRVALHPGRRVSNVQQMRMLSLSARFRTITAPTLPLLPPRVGATCPPSVLFVKS